MCRFRNGRDPQVDIADLMQLETRANVDAQQIQELTEEVASARSDAETERGRADAAEREAKTALRDADVAAAESKAAAKELDRIRNKVDQATADLMEARALQAAAEALATERLRLLESNFTTPEFGASAPAATTNSEAEPLRSPHRPETEVQRPVSLTEDERRPGMWRRMMEEIREG